MIARRTIYRIAIEADPGNREAIWVPDSSIPDRVRLADTMKLNEPMLNAVKPNKRNELKRLNQNGNCAGYPLTLLGTHSQLMHTVESRHLSQCVGQWQQGKTVYSHSFAKPTVREAHG